MLRRHSHNSQEAQVFLEYTIIIGVVILIIFAMSAMIKRATQGMILVVADQIGSQENADQDFDSGAYLINSYTSVRANTNMTTDEFVGNITYIFDDVILIDTESYFNLGFTNSD